MKLVHPISSRPAQPTRLAQQFWRQPQPTLTAVPTARFEFTCIVDTRTPMPGHSEVFRHLGTAAIAPENLSHPASDAAKGCSAPYRLAFFGGDGQEHSGIYYADPSGIKVIADSKRRTPADSARFAYFGSKPIFDDGQIVFLAQDETARISLYRDVYYQLTPLVETDCAVLGDRFVNLSNPAASGGNVAFMARLASTERKGVFLHRSGPVGGQTSAVAYQKMAGPVLQEVAVPAVDADGTVVFRAQDSQYQPGVYCGVGDVFAIATAATPIPGGTGQFTGFGDPLIADGIVTFKGSGHLMQQGLYQFGPNGIQALVDVHTRMPGSLELFSYFRAFAVFADGLAFLAGADHGRFGLFVLAQGRLLPVIELGDRLDGLRVTGLQLGRQGLCRSAVVFKAQFDDGSAGLFHAALHTEAKLS